jgi:hypothetical protein
MLAAATNPKVHASQKTWLILASSGRCAARHHRPSTACVGLEEAAWDPISPCSCSGRAVGLQCRTLARHNNAAGPTSRPPGDR